MPASQDKAAWERLGQMLTRRRVELDPRYANMELFAAETGINWRMAWDIENARRANFGRASIVLIEVAYALEHGSIDAALGGAPLRPLDTAGRRRYDDPALQAIWDTPGLTEAEKLAAIAAIGERREKMTSAGYTEEQQRIFEAAPDAFAELVRRERERRQRAEDEANGRPALPLSGDRTA